MRFAIVSLLFVACGHVTAVRPVEHHIIAAELAVGGPAVLLGSVPVPLPLSTLGARYGFAERWDVGAHAHLTTLYYKVAGFDIDADWLALPQIGRIPALTLGARVYAFTDFRSGMTNDADLSATASWLFGRWLSYATMTVQRDFLDRRFSWATAIGEQILWTRWSAQAELRWFDPGYDVTNSAPHWLSAGRGAFGMVLGIGYRFGG